MIPKEVLRVRQELYKKLLQKKLLVKRNQSKKLLNNSNLQLKNKKNLKAIILLPAKVFKQKYLNPSLM